MHEDADGVRPASCDRPRLQVRGVAELGLGRAEANAIGDEALTRRVPALMTRDAVAGETSARAATSCKVTTRSSIANGPALTAGSRGLGAVGAVGRNLAPQDT